LVNPVIEIEQAPPDEMVHDRAENVAEPLPPVWYQAMVSPETEPVKPERVAVQVTE